MTTTVILMRHGSHDRLGRILCGRMEGVGLSESGRAEVRAAGQRLSALGVTALYASPMQRTQETAALLAEVTGLAVETDPDLTEIDYGDWSGSSFEALAADPRWATWNYARGVGRPPSGESLLEVQSRMRRFVDRAVQRHPEGRIAAVGHGDPIKSILAHALGMPLDNLDRLEVSPASASVLVAGDWGMKVLSINEVAA